MNSPFSLVKNEYDKIWQKFSEIDRYDDVLSARAKNRKVFHETLLKYSNYFKNPEIMEVGSGTGFDINWLKKHNNSIKAYASDISSSGIKIGQKISDSLQNPIDHFVADTLNLPCKDGQLDIVFSQGLIEHFENPLAPIKEQLRVIRNGGFLIINVPQKYTGYTLMKRRKMRAGKWDLGWENEFSYGDLRTIGTRLKLSQKEVFGYQYWRSWLEPAFVLKDLLYKFHRRRPFKELPIFRKIMKGYDSVWSWLERYYGHYFLQNIVIVFQKK